MLPAVAFPEVDPTLMLVLDTCDEATGVVGVVEVDIEEEFAERSVPRESMPSSAAPAARAAFAPDFATPLARPWTTAAATGPRLGAEMASQCCSA